jgi:hypothetical protein
MGRSEIQVVESGEAPRGAGRDRYRSGRPNLFETSS